MVRFHCLGGAVLAGDDGTDLSSVLRHTKALAVLSLLNLGPSPGVQRREKLVALLWPESDERHARGSLRKALFLLRQALGDAAIRGRSERLTLDRNRIWCDAVAFRDAVDAGRHREAVELYRGALLDGVHVPGAVEFDRWLESERESLRRRASRSAWGLAEERVEAGDAPGGLQAARTALEFSPYDETALRRFVLLCRRTGDRALALREYERFRGRLMDELEVEPSPETRALIRGVRATCGCDGEEGHAAAAGPHPRSVAVLPFVDLDGEAGSARFAEGLHHEVISQLIRLDHLRVASRRSVLGYDESAKTVPAIAAELGVGRLVEGSVRFGRDRVRVTVDMIDATSGHSVWAGAFERPRDDLLEIQVDVADEMARSLLARFDA